MTPNLAATQSFASDVIEHVDGAATREVQEVLDSYDELCGHVTIEHCRNLDFSQIMVMKRSAVAAFIRSAFIAGFKLAITNPTGAVQ